MILLIKKLPPFDYLVTNAILVKKNFESFILI